MFVLALVSLASADLGAILGPRDRTPEAGRLFGRVAANEDSRPLRRPPGGTCGAPTLDHLAILQVAHWLAERTDRTLAEAFRVLSPRATGTRPPLRRQHRWTATLPAARAGAPTGWRECDDSDAGACDGRWGRHAPCWDRFREWAAETVERGAYQPPCPGTPIAWGGRMDDARAVARGLCRLACGETRNRFWGRPGDGCELDDPATVEIYDRVLRH